MELLTKKNAKEKEKLAKITSNFSEFKQSTDEKREQLVKQKQDLISELNRESSQK